MISVTRKGISILQFNNLNRFEGLFHFSTTRTGGKSIDKYNSLNLGLNSGDSRENVVTNRIALCNTLGINYDKFIFPKQTHTATVKVIKDEFFTVDPDEQTRFLHETDALITALKGVCVAIKTADCVPVLLFDPKREVVASIHAGWRGTAQNIVLKTVQKLVAEFGSDPADLVAGIGPSISPEVYEVGAEVWQQFPPECYENFNPQKSDKKLLDLWKANQYQLEMAGVPSHQIETAQLCTWSDHDRFYSARRDGAKTGRMATGIMIK